MKKAFVGLLILIICALVHSAYGATSVSGRPCAGGAAACGVTYTQGTFPVVTSSARLGWDDTVDRVYEASSYVATSASPVRTAYVNLKKNSSTTPDSTLTLYICPDNTEKPQTNANCTEATGTLSVASDLTTSSATYKYQFAAPGVTQEIGTTYWVKISSLSGLDAAKYVEWGYDGTGGSGVIKYSADDSTWGNTDVTSATAAFYLTSCVE
jgi:hypothetical protein